MKKVLSLNEIYTIVESQGEILLYQKISGKMYKIDYVNLLQTKLIDIISLIKERKLYKSSEY